MRILCICYEYPPIGGGGATVCRQLNEAFVAAGHEVHLVTSGMRDLPRFNIENGVRVHRVPCLRRHRHYSTAIELATHILPTYIRARRLATEVNFDCIHCHFIVPSGFVAYWLAHSTGLPYFLTAHGSDVPGYNPDRFDRLHRIIRPVWQRILTNARCTVTSSIFLKRLINARIPLGIEIIPNSLDTVVEQTTQKRDRILIATRMVERKGVQDFIRAATGMQPPWEIYVVGDGPYLPEIKALAKQYSVPATFLGFVPRDELRQLYRSARVFVFPSHQENFPMVLLEAMAAECAIVTTSAPGCLEVVGDAALVYAPGDVEALRAALKKLCGESALITELQGL
jgi:glycosyltransferase involved in cell wall biosynthesis